MCVYQKHLLYVYDTYIHTHTHTFTKKTTLLFTLSYFFTFHNFFQKYFIHSFHFTQLHIFSRYISHSVAKPSKLLFKVTVFTFQLHILIKVFMEIKHINHIFNFGHIPIIERFTLLLNETYDSYNYTFQLLIS